MEPTVTRLAALAAVAACAIAVVQAEPAHAQAPRTEAAQPMPIFPLGEPLSPVLEQTVESVERLVESPLDGLVGKPDQGSARPSPHPRAVPAPTPTPAPRTTRPRRRRGAPVRPALSPPPPVRSSRGAAPPVRPPSPSAPAPQRSRRARPPPARSPAPASRPPPAERRTGDRPRTSGPRDRAEPSLEPLRRLVAAIPDGVKLALSLMSLVLLALLAWVLVSRRQLARALRRAHSDVVTGLPNRAGVDEALARMIGQASRWGHPLGVAMLDIDHFKSVNDDFGHAKGDEVLAAVGAVARREVRAADFVGRYGGEEILLLLPDTDLEGTRVVAEKLRRAIGEVALRGVDRRITASVGVAARRGDREQLQGLIATADTALYRAKANGRDRTETAVIESPALAAARAPSARLAPSGGDPQRPAGHPRGHGHRADPAALG